MDYRISFYCCEDERHTQHPHPAGLVGAAEVTQGNERSDSRQRRLARGQHKPGRVETPRMTPITRRWHPDIGNSAERGGSRAHETAQYLSKTGKLCTVVADTVSSHPQYRWKFVIRSSDTATDLADPFKTLGSTGLQVDTVPSK